MACSTSGQTDLLAEETDQDVEVAKSIQIVKLADHEGEKEKNMRLPRFKLYEIVRN